MVLLQELHVAVKVPQVLVAQERVVHKVHLATGVVVAEAIALGDRRVVCQLKLVIRELSLLEINVSLFKPTIVVSKNFIKLPTPYL